MKRRECKPVVTRHGVLVEVGDSTCDRAMSRGIRVFLTEDGRCYIPYDAAVKLGVCREEQEPSDNSNGAEKPANPAIRFMEIIENLEKKGRRAQRVAFSLSADIVASIEDLHKRINKPKSHVTEALLRLALEQIGFPIGRREKLEAKESLAG